MAIFRQGVRVGPFDIRGGVSRGDLESSAYHKTEQDVRLGQKANPQSQMGRFVASMAAANGYARPARFAVRIYPPGNLEALMTEQQNVNVAAGQQAGSSEAADKAIDRAGMNTLSVALGRQINLHCDSVSMPGHDLQAETITQFGPPREMVTGHGFTGTIGASFYADSYLRERHFMEMWQKMAVNMTTHKAGYYDD